MASTPHAFFLNADTGTGQRFCIFHAAADGPRRGHVVYVHPFAEEMNKARRMAALHSRALAAAGFDVLQIDLQGCGDSSGDFGDASWEQWLADILLARRWLASQADTPTELWLWGLRAGCLLAAEAGARLDETVNYCFWQPATNGKLLLQQFLRMKVAAEMASGANKGLMDSIKQQLAAGQPVEVAGYLLAPGLARGLEHSQLKPGASRPGRVEWFELTTREDGAPSPATLQAHQQWEQAGHGLRYQMVIGPAFWQTTEIEEAPALLAATRQALRDGQAPGVA